MGLFAKAVKSESKLRLAIAGPSGSGKTYSALAIASALGTPIAFVDTEHGSASKYADIFDFDVLELDAPYHPDKYIEAIRGAAQAGYKVIILDSMTHAWNGQGGILELVEQATKRQKTPNSYTAWADVTPVQNRLIEAIVSANIHIIATMRSKQEYVQEKNERGSTVIRKVGMAPIQRDGFEYEFDVFFDMDTDNNAIVSKTRCPDLTGKVIAKPGKQVADILNAWLRGAQQAQGAPVDSGEVVFKAAPHYIHAWNQLTGNEYDLVERMRALHRESDGPASDKQYQYLTGVLDALTDNNHSYLLSLLCQTEISMSNKPGAKVANVLLKKLVKTIKDENGEVVPSPDYRQDVADMMTHLAKRFVPMAA